MATRTIEQHEDAPGLKAALAGAPPEGGVEKLQVKIGGMSCSFCVSTIEKGVSRIDGVLDVKVNLTHEEALVAFDPARAAFSPVAVFESLKGCANVAHDEFLVRCTLQRGGGVDQGAEGIREPARHTSFINSFRLCPL